MSNPVLVEVTRGNVKEMKHRGAACIVNAQGQIIKSWGDIKNPVYGRSAVKLIQALPLIETGAAEAWRLEDHEIALACSSHQGEDFHTEAVEKWLRKVGKDERILKCGTHNPLHAQTSKKLIQHQQNPSPLHNACSGKHTGFITTALHLNENLENYNTPEHPVQKRIESTLSELTGYNVKNSSAGIDGCDIPTFAIPLYNIALAMAHFADPSVLKLSHQKAIQIILESIRQHPKMLTGTKAFDSNIAALTHGKVITKMGAGGIQTAILRNSGWGIALKIDDGNNEAAAIAILEILYSLNQIDESTYQTLIPRYPVKTHWGKVVGSMHSTHFTEDSTETNI